MTVMKDYNPGTFSWVDLATTDAEAAKAFYTSLFSWGTIDSPVPDGGVYTMFPQGEQAVGAMYGMDEGMQQQGIPPHWNSYVTVASADDSATRARQLGGTVLMEPFDVMEAGRMAVILDPAGASFCIWQPDQNCGAELVNVPNSLCWNELYTNDLDAAKEYYSGLFDWNMEVMEMPTGEYTVCKVGDRPNAGMMPIQEEWGEVPPHWGVYFSVEDCDATMAQAIELGGKVNMEPIDIPEVGRFGGVQDPQGARFTVMKLAQIPE